MGRAVPGRLHDALLPKEGAPMNDHPSLSDYVQLWVDKPAPHQRSRANRMLTIVALVVAGSGILLMFFDLAFRLVLGRFW